MSSPVLAPFLLVHPPIVSFKYLLKRPERTDVIMGVSQNSWPTVNVLALYGKHFGTSIFAVYRLRRLIMSLLDARHFEQNDSRSPGTTNINRQWSVLGTPS